MSKELAMEFAEELVEFLNLTNSVFHCTDICAKILEKEGFKKLDLKDRWELEAGRGYYIEKNKSAVIAFRVCSTDIENAGFKIVGSHTDIPAIKIKPNPEIISEKSMLKLNVEIYGGPILNTWMDRPLSIAGKVTLRGKDAMNPVEELVDFEEAVAIIPNVAIHINNEVNKGLELNRQKDMLPLIAFVEEEFEKEDYLVKMIAEQLNVTQDKILDFELFLYEHERAKFIGVNREFISASGLDNRCMVYESMIALLDSQCESGVNMIAAFDNEEVGSTTKQGANSMFMRNVMQRIALALGKGQEEFLRALYSSFMISADAAHAVHPNSPEKHEPTNRPVLNKGPVIKINANQSYTSDSVSNAIYQSICIENEIPYQKFLNPSDKRGGSTIGPLSSSFVDIRAIDIGNPMLAMHSIRELAGSLDQYEMYKSLVKFFSM